MLVSEMKERKNNKIWIGENDQYLNEKKEKDLCEKQVNE
jgi:hypothetical protein